METNKRNGTPRKQRVRRSVVAFCATIVTASAALVGAAPAQAATPWFEIFYSPNCGAGKSASKVYVGTNAGERWINDKFDNKNFGTAGYNEKIAYNAASVYIYHASVQINYDQNRWWGAQSATGQCFNLDGSYRNSNRNWRTDAK
ncbi:MAG: hypothetical protein J0I18_01685 [Actinobacteria bacterium]|nr:hypothetical protein [Actinomycetota bacterium]